MINQIKKPLVSVIMPTYNRSGLLREALASVKAQEGNGELFDMEVIVIDDCSQDDTPEVMLQYPWTQYIRLERNHGQSAAVNIGIRASKGAYIALLDDDDLWLPNRLKAHLPVFEDRPEVGVVYGQGVATGDGADMIWPDAQRAPSGNAFMDFLMEEFVLTDCALVRRDAFEKAGYFDEKLKTMSHYDMFLRLAFHVPFAFLAGPIAIARFSEDAKWFTNIKSGRYVVNTLYIVERVLKWVKDPVRRAGLRRQAQISWRSQFNYWLNKAGQIDQIRDLLLSSIQEEPWMLTDPKALPVIRTGMIIVARWLALNSDRPIADVRSFCGKVEMAVAEAFGPGKWLELAQFKAAVWMAVAVAQTESGSMVQCRNAVLAVLHALPNNPAVINKTVILKILIRSVVRGPNYDKLTAAVKTIFKTQSTRLSRNRI